MTEGNAADGTHRDDAPSPDRAFRIVFALLAAATLAVLWGVRYLPMTDLPQHAAQVALWMELGDPASGVGERFEANLFTPYLLAPLLARALASFLPVATALQCVVTLAVLGLPLSLLILLRRTGGDPWGCLWGFVFAFGFAFGWGLLSFLLATPIGILLVAEGLAGDRRERLRPLRIGSLGLLLAASHALVLLLAAAILAALCALRRPPRRAAADLLPLVPALACLPLWFLLSGRSAPVPWQENEWQLDPLVRLARAPAHLVGADRGVVAGAAVLGAAAAYLLLARPSWSRSPVRWVPFAVAAAAYLLAPRTLFDIHALFQRFVVFPFAFLLVPLDPSPRARDRTASRILVAAVAAAFLLDAGLRFRRFDREAREFEPLLAAIEPGRTVQALVYSPRSRHVPGTPYLHFAGWVQAQGGGEIRYSFAHARMTVVRYRVHDAEARRRQKHLSRRPAEFEWDLDGDADCFLLRAEGGQAERLFLPEAGSRVREVVRSGPWALFERAEGPR